ncbi:MAG: hypothetical protein JWM80_6528, partial [Cyanobacteria bacterium RYN_339]|nr:hypothetical protein [Cyanobacteria bacterium RYN_339]
ALMTPSAPAVPGPVVPAPAPAPSKPHHHHKPKPKPPAQPAGPTSQQLFASRQSWYISQYYSSKFNSREDVPGIDNANCGPTSLTMVATAFGKINPSAGQADAAIEKSRKLMGDGNDQRHGTSCEGIARGARAYGLDAKVMSNIHLDDIKRELAKGRLPIINGNYIRANLTQGGGHFYVVTKIEGNKAYLNDPAIPSGPRVVSTSVLMSSIWNHFGHTMISVGPGR